MACPSCKESLHSPNSRVRATICGHIFHDSCMRAWITASNQDIFRDEIDGMFACPTCQEYQSFKDDTIRIYLPEVTTGPEESLDTAPISALAKKQEEIVELHRQMNRLKLQVREEKEAAEKQADEPGSRLKFNMFGSRVSRGIFHDATCLNCESLQHQTRDCPNPCFLRSNDKTTFEKWNPIENYCALAQLPGPVAGAIFTLFEEDYSLLISCRVKLQIVFASYFFGDACWQCGSPYHVHLSCNGQPDPALKKFARDVHNIIKPLTEEQRKLKTERYQANVLQRLENRR